MFYYILLTNFILLSRSTLIFSNEKFSVKQNVHKTISDLYLYTYEDQINDLYKVYRFTNEEVITCFVNYSSDKNTSYVHINLVLISFSVQFDVLGPATNYIISCDNFANIGGFNVQNYNARRFHNNMLNYNRFKANFQKNMLNFYQDSYVLDNKQLETDFNLIKNQVFLDNDQTLDENQNINKYYIQSSHNSYLEDNEYFGTSVSERALIRQLYLGFRCLELDLWPIKQPSGSPYDIYVGIQHKSFILSTNKIDLISTMKIIGKYGFILYDSPIIITFENNLYEPNEFQYFLEALEKSGANYLMAENLKNENAWKYSNLKNTIVIKMHFSDDDKNLSVSSSQTPIVNSQLSGLYSQQYIDNPLIEFIKGYSYMTYMTKQIFVITKEELKKVVDNDSTNVIDIQSVGTQGSVLQFYKLSAFQTKPDAIKDIETDQGVYYNSNKSFRYVSIATKCYPEVGNMVWFNFEENSIYENTKNQVEAIKNSSSCTSMTRMYTDFYRNLSDNYDPLRALALGINILALNTQNLGTEAQNYINFFSPKKGYRELNNSTGSSLKKYKIQINQVYIASQFGFLLLQINIHRAVENYQKIDDLGKFILNIKNGQNARELSIVKFEARDNDFLIIRVGERYLYSAMIKDLHVSQVTEDNKIDYRAAILRVLKNYFWDGSFIKLRILND